MTITRPISEESETARRYREHAEELRTIAEHDRDPATRNTLKSIADDYQHMAATLDAIDRTNNAMKKRNPWQPL